VLIEGEKNLMKEAGVVITGEQGVAEQAVVATKEVALATEGSQNVAKEVGLATSTTQSMTEKGIAATKKAELITDNAMKVAAKGELATTITQATTEKVIGVTKKGNLATSILSGAKEKLNAGISIVRAIANVVAGSGWMGPLALGVGAAAGLYLWSQMSSAGGGEGGGGGGGSAPSVGSTVSMPTENPKTEEIKPVNQAAENKKMLENATLQGPSKDVARGGNTNVYVSVDPITGQKVEKVMYNDPSTGRDRSKNFV
jgi:hypothetical protein